VLVGLSCRRYDLGLNNTSYAALGVAIVAMAVALWRAKKMPTYESHEQALDRRIAELEGTVASLQRLLFEKEQQNKMLLDELSKLTTRVWELERSVPVPPAPAAHADPAAHPTTLLGVLGDDPALRIDLQVLREVEQYGWRVTRLFPATKEKLKALLDRYRVNGRPLENLHIAVRSSEAGLAFGDELVTSGWLSANLKNVKVLLINGCNSDQLGDWLGIVPVVLTMREEISHDDAALFARLFWVALASGQTPDDAYYHAILLSPQGVAEFVELVG